MPMRKLGTSGLDVSTLGLGCMGMSYHRGPAPNRTAMIALLRQAVELGVTLFDTAEAYGPFINEKLVGDALAPVRKGVAIATKFGFNCEAGKSTELNSQPEQIRRVAEAAPKRLNRDGIDLFYQHRLDPNVPIEEVAGGGVGHPTDARRTRHRFRGLQPAWQGLSLRHFERKHQVRGQQRQSRRLAAFYRRGDEGESDTCGCAECLCSTKGATTSQIALAWVLAQKPCNEYKPEILNDPEKLHRKLRSTI